ncbi:hypothetical protein QYE76_024812 [Lolium multiflorum]|uniref:Mitochondrial protein n=1 Tax=Lolium multiflorum TaxID=4521 RepID=A0AAD8VW14_LOLMU|nr:hypothetical protein QYE76_024812 [Lolium multiflorum]
MHDPREPHLLIVKRILRYLKGTLDHGLTLHSSTSHSLIAYSDADWAGCPVTRRSTSGYCVFLGDNLVSWSSRRQPTVSRSSADAEYRAIATAVTETCWLRNLLQELGRPLDSATIVYCDNLPPATSLSPYQRGHTSSPVRRSPTLPPARRGVQRCNRISLGSRVACRSYAITSFCSAGLAPSVAPSTTMISSTTEPLLCNGSWRGGS